MNRSGETMLVPLDGLVVTHEHISLKTNDVYHGKIWVDMVACLHRGDLEGWPLFVEITSQDKHNKLA